MFFFDIGKFTQLLYLLFIPSAIARYIFYVGFFICNVNRMMFKYCSIRNVRRALPYFHHSITDAEDRAREIGNCKETYYEHNPGINPANIRLRKG